MTIESAQVADELEGLLPDLEDSRDTHLQWRDCAQVHHDRNPQIGDRAFHAGMVCTYDHRIATVKKAAALLRRL